MPDTSQELEGGRMAAEVLSVVEDYGPQASACGYCGGRGTSVSHGMQAEQLSVECYQVMRPLGHEAGRGQERPRTGGAAAARASAVDWAAAR